DRRPRAPFRGLRSSPATIDLRSSAAKLGEQLADGVRGEVDYRHHLAIVHPHRSDYGERADRGLFWTIRHRDDGAAGERLHRGLRAEEDLNAFRLARPIEQANERLLVFERAEQIPDPIGLRVVDQVGLARNADPG